MQPFLLSIIRPVPYVSVQIDMIINLCDVADSVKYTLLITNIYFNENQ